VLKLENTGSYTLHYCYIKTRQKESISGTGLLVNAYKKMDRTPQNRQNRWLWAFKES